MLPMNRYKSTVRAMWAELGRMGVNWVGYRQQRDASSKNIAKGAQGQKWILGDWTDITQSKTPWLQKCNCYFLASQGNPMSWDICMSITPWCNVQLWACSYTLVFLYPCTHAMGVLMCPCHTAIGWAHCEGPAQYRGQANRGKGWTHILSTCSTTIPFLPQQNVKKLRVTWFLVLFDVDCIVGLKL